MSDGAADVVLRQLPPAGASLRTGGHVMAYTVSEQAAAPEELVRVPELSGMSDIDCARLTRQRGLAIEMDGTGLCVRQTPGGGDYVAPGTTVRVTLSTAADGAVPAEAGRRSGL